MELKKRAVVLLLQFTVIVSMSVAAYYAFQNTTTAYEINGLCFYRYLAYAFAIVLGYICFSPYKKSVGLAFSLAFSAVVLSPLGQKAIEFFPSAVPLLGVLMGVTTVLIIPSSRGRGFFEFLLVLTLPAILAVSRIGGSDQLLATTQSIGYYELSAVTTIILGGYFYLRYATSANVSSLELLSCGGNEKEVGDASKRCNVTAILIAVGASGIAALLMITAPIVADALRATIGTTPLYVLALAMGAGIAVTTIFYVFQIFVKKRAHRYV